MSDAPVLAEFNIRLAHETENMRLDPTTVALGIAALLRDAAKGVYYVAEVNGAVVGQVMITYEWSDWRNGNLWWLQSVYVQKEFRGRGVFRALFGHLTTLARGQGEVRALRLYMHSENERARRSYEALGMRRTAYEVFELDLPASEAARTDSAAREGATGL
ncbi:MAG TPA: GNAT family N-acetyltransferase [Verrucomicrobiae bacterium]|nr:GNAT family N-acetyltransferase [Verrucomicrobiae bacterium]